MSRLASLACLLFLTLFGALANPRAEAHAVPDVPVRSAFDAGGGALIQVEVDPRCFSDDPTNAASLVYEFAKTKPETERAELRQKAREFVTRTVDFYFEPLGRIAPEFEFEFTGKAGAPLVKDDDVVVLTGSWRTTVPAGIQGYRIRANAQTKLSVLFLNHLRGEGVGRIQVLFPNELSYLLDLNALTSPLPSAPAAEAHGANGTADWARTALGFFLQGFLHVLPKGLDHILFVLGLFLLCRQWKPLLWQVSTFTVAHTLTLALATMGAVQVSPKIVEPVIAASLVVVALENIFRPQYSRARLVVVFVFGLVHGLGFAGALQDLQLPMASLVVSLLGFNLGVEGGQLAVIGLAFSATVWLRDPARYRQMVVIPGSVAIALMGAWWTVTRVFFAS